MDAHSGVPYPPSGESPTNRRTAFALTEVRKTPRVTEVQAESRRTRRRPANRLDRISETAVRGLTLRTLHRPRDGRY